MTKRLIPRAEIEAHARAHQAFVGLTEDEFQRDLAFRIHGVQRLGFLAEEKETSMSEQVESKSSKTKAKKPTAPKSVKRDLEVALTDTEMLKRNEELLAAMQARDDLIAQKSEATSNINASIKLAAQHVKELASALRNKKEKREVDCIERMIFPTNTVEIVRTDTGAIVEKRAMTPDERQPVLFDAPLTATVGEIAGGKKAKKGVAALLDDVAAFAVAPESTFNRCEKTLRGDRCTRDVGHPGSHGYRDPSPKA